MKQRIITGALGIAIVLPIIFYGGIPFLLLTYLMATVALYEVFRMKKIRLISTPGLLSLAVLWIFLIPSKYNEVIGQFHFTKIEFVTMGILLCLTYTVASKNRFTFDDAGFAILSTLYVGIGFFYFNEVRDIKLTWVFYALFVIWATDSGAYFIGRSMGKKKLWPEISPNKTVEGFFGGVICALIVAVLFGIFSDIPASMPKLLIATAVLSVFGQIGDLVESALKRYYGVKDSGNILPGHGGVLDRFDSLLFVLPIMTFILIN
ncbi:phosphatidate cytidylyltransferase [Falsibacillus albus]|uniref:Phosphatidate cytidylyltransferase n=1 Tax=Falsibacillus albus TaxID=2478915 RepID=A0A3L7K4S8_9BACI|nr:phosphatidate cytidylyltransferase [Falsibacillus albus]RLQ95712.1 phosphatidate cytidylyltransferase [Falsibacillus albus]